MQNDEKFNRILVLIMQALLYHCISCMVYQIISPEKLPPAYFPFLLGIPLFIFSAIRAKCNNFAVFFLMHALVSGVLLLFIPDPVTRTITGCCVAVMVILSFRLRLKPVFERQESCPPAVSVFLFLLVYLNAQFNHYSFLMQTSYYEIFLYLVLFAVYKCLANTDRFLKSNEDIDKFPSGQIKSLNKIILCIFILFLLIGMTLMQHMPVNYLFSAIGQILLIILRGILRFIFGLFGNSKIIEEEAAPMDDLSPLPLTAGEMSPILQILERFLMAAFYLLVIYIFVKLFIKFLYELYKRFYDQQKLETDESEFLWKNPPVKERIKRIRAEKEPLPAGSANQKIRRLYKKYMRRQFGKKTVIPSSMTPTELENHTDPNKLNTDLINLPVDDPQKQQRIALYEKARYSQWECSNEEVEIMKQHLQNK